MSKVIFTAVCLIAGAMLAGCAEAPPKALRFELLEDGSKHLWPAKPEVPRYMYVGQLTGENNFRQQGDSAGVGGVLRWIAGIDAEDKNQAVLQRPQCGAVDKAGRIFVTDISRRAVFVFDKPAKQLQVWEWAGKDTRFVAPVGVVTTDKGQVLVADAELGRVFRLDRNGQPIGEIGAGILKRPTGMARDEKTGMLYVSDTRAHDIKIFDAKGQLVKTLGQKGRAAGEFNAPTHLYFSAGRLYVSDTLNSRIQVFDADGYLVKRFGERGLYVGNLTRPKGIAVDDEGNIYVVESYYDHLLIFDSRGRFLLPIGGTGTGVGQFYLPAGIWTDQRNRIFISDMFNGRVVVMQYLGER